jgi:hypothetical protein
LQNRLGKPGKSSKFRDSAEVPQALIGPAGCGHGRSSHVHLSDGDGTSVAFQRLSWFPRSNPKRSRLAWADIRHALFQGICPEAKNPRYREMADSALIFPMGHIRCMVGPTLDPTLLLFELQPAIATIAATIQAA